MKTSLSEISALANTNTHVIFRVTFDRLLCSLANSMQKNRDYGLDRLV